MMGFASLTILRVTPPPPRNPPPAGTSTPDCGRHRHCRRGPPATNICPCARCRPGSSLRRGCRRGSSRRRRCRARCAGRGAAARPRPSSGRSRSRRSRCRIAIMASQKRSSSAFDFRFGRLDHQRARHRKAHGRRVEAVVDQALGDVVDGDAAGCLQRPRIDDAFMRDAAVRVPVEHREMRLQPAGDVVGVEDRDLGRPLQALAAHHQDVDLGDRQDRRRAERRRRHRPDRHAASRRRSRDGPAGYGARCALTPIGPMPGPPPPCGMQKVLCRFRWQTSAPKSPGRDRPTCAFRLAPSR